MSAGAAPGVQHIRCTEMINEIARPSAIHYPLAIALEFCRSVLPIALGRPAQLSSDHTPGIQS